MKVFFSIVFLFSLVVQSFSQPITKADSLIQEISKLQVHTSPFYNQGQFTSQRGKNKVKEDNNIFYSSLIVFTLSKIINQSSTANTLIDSVCRQVVSNYKFFKNQNGNPTFNFWKTNPPQFFPNSNLAKHKYFNIPDDADCTSLIYLTDASLYSHVTELKDKLSMHSNLNSKKIRNTFKRYKNYHSYSTWFGKKMPIEFDICVQANILYFVFENKLKLNINDSATIGLIKQMVLSGDYIKYSNYLSPSYKKKSVVLYHLARLLGKFSIYGLNDCRDKIKTDIEDELKKHQSNFMDKIILSSAYIRMGGKPLPVQYPSDCQKQMNEFVFFNADLFSVYARPQLKFISEIKLFTIPFHCKSYCLALLYENEILKNNSK